LEGVEGPWWAGSEGLVAAEGLGVGVEREREEKALVGGTTVVENGLNEGSDPVFGPPKRAPPNPPEPSFTPFAACRLSSNTETDQSHCTKPPTLSKRDVQTQDVRRTD
jgi:hypothetical protein